jgi:hypothetical protein
MRPCVAFSAATPVKAAGPRTEIMTSLPMPIGDMPAASAADSSPNEPSGVRSRFHGLLVRPVTRLLLSVQAENSGRLPFLSGIPPTALKRATAVASLSGMLPAKSFEPRWVRTPAVSRESLMNGTPCRGPSGASLATALSAASALASACSAMSVTTALICGFTASMRSKCAWTTSRDESCFVRMSAASAGRLLIMDGAGVGDLSVEHSHLLLGRSTLPDDR